MRARWCKSMPLIDANVILRYLLNDHEEMSAQAKQVVMNGACTTTEVLAEVVYVLIGVYRAEREEVSQWLTCFLDEVSLENKQAILYALRVYSETSLDFIDCVLIGYHRVQGQSIFSFDKKLNRLLNDSAGDETT